MISNNLFTRFYPDGSKDGTTIFYNWLRDGLQRGYSALNIGAGPGASDKIRSLKGEVAMVTGIDIDNEVLMNNDLDYAYIYDGITFPFKDCSFDIAWSDYVLEHVSNPEVFLSEVHRVLKPGARYYFRTPNRLHYVSLIARMTPDWFHHLIANRVRGLSKDAHEPYPTRFKLNTENSIMKYSRIVGFATAEFRLIEAEPSYLKFNSGFFLLGVMYERLVNGFDFLSPLRANIFGYLQKGGSRC